MTRIIRQTYTKDGAKLSTFFEDGYDIIAPCDPAINEVEKQRKQRMTGPSLKGDEYTMARQRRKIARLNEELKEAYRKCEKLQKELEYAKSQAAANAWEHLPKMGTTWD